MTIDDMVNVQLINMDVGISEQIVSNADGTYTVFLNARLTKERQMESFFHAINHILCCDFEKHDSDMIEYEAHSL